MTAPQAAEGEFIWATRGRQWGFRFLRSGGLEDPLRVYEHVILALGDQSEAWCRVGDKVGLRFPDPDERRDAAGRVIPHDFVLLGPWTEGITSVEDGRLLIWPVVADVFGSVWDQPEPPAAQR